MISVVIPVFNREDTIARCLDSVLDQSYSDIEVIVVDDCSTDNTVDIVSSYSDSRIRLKQLNENSGAAVARNVGTEMARGEFIAYHDSDDVWYPNKLAMQLDAIAASDADICLCRLKRFGYGRDDDSYVPSKRIRHGCQNFEQVLRGSLFAMPAVVVKSTIAKQVKFDTNLKWHEDYEWSIRLSKDHKVYLIDEVLGEVFLQTNSVSVRNVDYEYDFYNRVIPKFRSFKDDYPWFYSMLLVARGNCAVLNGKQSFTDFKLAYKNSPSLKGLIRCLLASTPVYSRCLQTFKKKDSIQ